MKRVLQVSISERAVELTLLVTESPKKLYPLQNVSKEFSVANRRDKGDLPNTDHDQDAGNPDGFVFRDFPPRFN